MPDKLSLLITGTSGFLGKNIVHHFAAAGHSVRTIEGRKNFELRLEQELKGNHFDAIIHAGFDVQFTPCRKVDLQSENLRNTRAIVDNGNRSKVPHLIFLSAAGTLGVSKTSLARNEDDFGKTEPGFESYLKTTYIQEKIACAEILKGSSAKTCSLFLSSVYGPGMQPDVLASLSNLKGLFPAVVCPPGGTSFLDVRDFIDMLDRVVRTAANGDFVVSSGNTSYADLFRTAIDILKVGIRKQVVVLPEKSKFWLLKVSELSSGNFLNAAIITSMFGYKYYSPEKARRNLKWTPAFRLRDTIEHALMGKTERVPEETEFEYHDARAAS